MIPTMVQVTHATKKSLLHHPLAHCVGSKPSLGGIWFSGCWASGMPCHSHCILKPLSSTWAHEEQQQPAWLVEPALARMGQW